MTDSPYRDPWEDLDVDQEVYEKALALKRIEAIEAETLSITSDGDGWRVDEVAVYNTVDFYGESYDKEKRRFQELKYVVNLAYQEWYKDRTEQWKITTSEAIAYELLQEDDAEECPHVNIEDVSQDEIIILAEFYDLIVEQKLCIRHNPHSDVSRWLISAPSGDPYLWSDICDPGLGNALEKTKEWFKENFERERDKVAKRAVELGILKSAALAMTETKKASVLSRVYNDPGPWLLGIGLAGIVGIVLLSAL